MGRMEFGLKLAVFVDQLFWFDGEYFSTNEAFIKFITAFTPFTEHILCFGRVADELKTAQYVLDAKSIDVCRLPFYPDIYALIKNGFLILYKSCTIFSKNIDEYDLVLLCVPNPLSYLFAYICIYKKKPFFMLVRQNIVEMVRHQNAGLKKVVAVCIARLLEKLFQCLAKNHVTFIKGHEIYQKYKMHDYSPVFKTSYSLISQEDIAQSRVVHNFMRHDSTHTHVLYVGRLDPGKGLEHLLAAMHLILLERREGMTLHLVGSGRLETELRQQAQELQLAEHIKFHGYIAHGEELLALYRASSVFVLPSLSEGLPLVLLEAMACGVPIVATRVGGIPDIISDGVHGLLVQPGEPHALACAMRRLIVNELLRQQLRENAFAHVAQYTLEAQRDQMLATLQQKGLWTSADLSA